MVDSSNMIFEKVKPEDVVFGDSLGEGNLFLIQTLQTMFLTLIVCLGAFGNVRVGWLKHDKDNKYAIKTMKKAEIIASKHVDHIENEKNILEKINHPFAVSIIILNNKINFIFLAML